MHASSPLSIPAPVLPALPATQCTHYAHHQSQLITDSSTHSVQMQSQAGSLINCNNLGQIKPTNILPTTIMGNTLFLMIDVRFLLASNRKMLSQKMTWPLEISHERV